MRKGLCVSLPLVVLAWVVCVDAQQNSLICRVDDPAKVRDCNILSNCLYTVYPVEVSQASGDMAQSNFCGGMNGMLSMFDGPASCRYYSSLISTNPGRVGFATIVQRELSKSSFRGVDIRCDPTANGINQTAYNGALRMLRDKLGRGFIITVRVENPNLDPVLIQTLNDVVDLVSCPSDSDTSTIQSLIGEGLVPRKIVIDVELPPTVTCPMNSAPVKNGADAVKAFNLFGATIQLNRDDTDNTCGNGPFPQTRKLKSSLSDDDDDCDFEGYQPDATDRSQFYGCTNGKLNLYKCPHGQLFDALQSTCIPVIRCQCNETSCFIITPFNATNNTNFVPIPVFYPQQPTTTELTTLPTTTTPAPTTTTTTTTSTTTTTTPATTTTTTAPITTTPSPVTLPPVTLPPVTLPPVTLPPVTTPPVTLPPVTLPPVTLPPVTLPPVTPPPVTLPVTVPTLPPVTPPPVTLPPAATLPPPVVTVPTTIPAMGQISEAPPTTTHHPQTRHHSGSDSDNAPSTTTHHPQHPHPTHAPDSGHYQHTPPPTQHPQHPYHPQYTHDTGSEYNGHYGK